MSDLEKHRQAAAAAIRALRRRVQWKPNKAEQHLAKRKAKKHLSQDITLEGYDSLISSIVNEPNNAVYHYPFRLRNYYAVCGKVQDAAWLVIFGPDGILETAFPPNHVAEYLKENGFALLGRIGEILCE